MMQSLCDHNIRLREDPTYLKKEIDDWEIHAKAKEGASASHASETNYKRIACTQLLTDAYIAIFACQDVSDYLLELGRLVKSAQGAGTEPAEDLECQRALRRLHEYLYQAANNHLTVIAYRLPAVMGRFCKLADELTLRDDADVDKFHLVNFRPTPDCPQIEKRIINTFWTLVDESARELYGPVALVQEMQDMLEDSSPARDLVGEWQERHFTVAAHYLYIQSQLRLDEPLSSSADYLPDSVDDEPHVRMQELELLSESLLALGRARSMPSYEALCSFPSGGTPSPEDIEQMKTVEHNVAAWFDAADEYLNMAEGMFTYVGGPRAGRPLPPAFLALMREKGNLYPPSSALRDAEAHRGFGIRPWV